MSLFQMLHPGCIIYYSFSKLFNKGLSKGIIMLLKSGAKCLVPYKILAALQFELFFFFYLNAVVQCNIRAWGLYCNLVIGISHLSTAQSSLPLVPSPVALEIQRSKCYLRGQVIFSSFPCQEAALAIKAYHIEKPSAEIYANADR